MTISTIDQQKEAIAKAIEAISIVRTSNPKADTYRAGIDYGYALALVMALDNRRHMLKLLDVLHNAAGLASAEAYGHKEKAA